MSFLRHYDHAHNADLSLWEGWYQENALLGYVQAPLRDAALDHGILRRTGQTLQVMPGPTEEITSAFADFARIAFNSGLLLQWVGEAFPVKATVAEPTRFTMERTLTALMGCLTFGVHLNGYVPSQSGSALWIATRSHQKPTFPGMLDNMVGGGQPAGLTLFANLSKECKEEAGIPPALAQDAVPVGTISYCHSDGRGLKRDVLFCYDLALPEDFHPECTDGEVDSFEKLPLADVLDIIRTTNRFKYNCNLVILDFAIRHGALNGDNTPEYLALCQRRNQLEL